MSHAPAAAAKSISTVAADEIHNVMLQVAGYKLQAAGRKLYTADSKPEACGL
jgi:hypothetical protein